MPTPFQMVLALHVLGSSVALLFGPVPMLAKKGGRLHRKAGRVFWIAMGCSSVSAFALALMVDDKLLLTIAVLTAFLIATGLRAAKFRQGLRPDWVDNMICLALAGFGSWLLWIGIPQGDITEIFFGAGSLVLAARHVQLLRARDPDWLLAHIAGMGGAYVAAATAFIVVNFGFLPKPVAFIVPTLIGTVLITWASFRHASLGPRSKHLSSHRRADG